jgi:hypothetical protein
MSPLCVYLPCLYVCPLQTAAICSFVGALPFTGFCFASTAYMLSKRRFAPVIACYLLYMTFFDQVPFVHASGCCMREKHMACIILYGHIATACDHSTQAAHNISLAQAQIKGS